MLTGPLAQRLCDVSKSTPVGEAFRSSWLPVLRIERLEAGGSPVPFTLLGEPLVAFRAANGEVAVFDEHCPHRGCSLSIAHPKDDSLVCVFHGWKFHVSGKCIDTPSEADPKFTSRVPLRSYPTREAGGALWVCLDRKAPPPFPDFLFNQLPADRLYARVGMCEYNWLTGVEGVLDPSHVGVLHADWVGVPPSPGAKVSQDVLMSGQNLVPKIEIEPTEYGFSYAAIRSLPDGQTHMRVHEYVAPSGVFVGNSTAERQLFVCLTPIDNFRTMFWFFWFTPDGPMTPDIRAFALQGADLNDDNYCGSLREQPFWGQNRDKVRNQDSFTGLNSILFEDIVAGEAQGRWTDPKREFLGPSDAAIGYLRRYLLDRIPETGTAALAHEGPVDYVSIAGIAGVHGLSTDWKTWVAEERARRRSRLSKAPGSLKDAVPAE
ncbi:Rieske 2Fe-2S domain-containing protein [Phenylobacterium sp.]|jgi:nitrite reductase/ring-hydroxylating ferredoxin subunit|uniref:Rieske 2Fe-2S domain-containing protein n=1 Tax=Phenylobacterium sp. TaxID=1871053 RepID=UPI002E329E4D|nr:Rieske 2Fe-2S domain-containing protein [Phenylobacterium sp.]HEX3364619.1 Rieske 2Fe-2S domain-containing protein [Phenylobacterium sp.]